MTIAENEAPTTAAYEIRRQARAPVAPVNLKPWKRRLIWGGAALGLLALLLTGWYVYYALRHVNTMRARVSAAVVSLSADVDARLLELRVRPGQQVSQGEVLARLDDSELRSMLATAEAGLAIAESQHAQAVADHSLIEARTEAEVALAGARVVIAQGRVASAQATIALREAQLAEEIRRAEAQQAEAGARYRAIEKGARLEDVEAARARLATAKARAALSELEVQQVAELVERQIESPLSLEVKRTDLAVRKNEVREAEFALERLLAGATEEERQALQQVLATRDADLALARVGDKQIHVFNADLAIRTAELREAEAELKRAEAQRLEIRRAEKRIQSAEAELRRAQANVDTRLVALEAKSIVSPVSGTIIRTLDRVGEVVRRGVPTILVADDGAGRWFEGFVREDYAGRLAVGQEARVEVIVGSRDYVRAEVVEIGLATSSFDQMGVASQAGMGAGGGYIASEQVWVKLRPVGEQELPLPGMSARAIIRVW